MPSERSSVLCTIGAHDLDKTGRRKRYKERKRERDRIQARKRRAKQRQAKGGKTRAKYLTDSVEAAKPWEVEGISRRTWYYRQRAKQQPQSASL